MEKGFEGFEGEIPPPTALAGRRVKGMKAEKAKKRSWGMSMWAGWGSKHDSATVSSTSLLLSIHTNTICRSFVKRKQISLMTKRTCQPLLSTPINLLSTEPQMPQKRTEAVARLSQPLAYPAHALTPATPPSPTKAKPTHPATTSPALPRPCQITQTPPLHPIDKLRHYHPHPLNRRLKHPPHKRRHRIPLQSQSRRARRQGLKCQHDYARQRWHHYASCCRCPAI
jgi:hypothetical protein